MAEKIEVFFGADIAILVGETLDDAAGDTTLSMIEKEMALPLGRREETRLDTIPLDIRISAAAYSILINRVVRELIVAIGVETVDTHEILVGAAAGEREGMGIERTDGIGSLILVRRRDLGREIA